MSNNPGPAAYVPKVVDVVAWSDNKECAIKAMGPTRASAGLAYYLESGKTVEESFVYCRYIRPPTPAECRAAGFDPAVVGPRPEWVRITREGGLGLKVGTVHRVLSWREWGDPVVAVRGDVMLGDAKAALMGNSDSTGLGTAWEPAFAPPPTPSARVVALEAELAAVKAERDDAGEWRDRWKKEHDEQCKLAHEMRVRAEAAEAECARLKSAPVNGDAAVKFQRPVWSATGPLESPTPSAREAELERERDDARYLRAMAVVDRDAALRDAAEQRGRAEAAERARDEAEARERATEAQGHAICERANRAEATVRELRVQLERAERERDEWCVESKKLRAAQIPVTELNVTLPPVRVETDAIDKPTPAPATTLDALRAAFVDALARNESSEFDACLSWNAREAKNQLKAAIAARAKGGGA